MELPGETVMFDTIPVSHLDASGRVTAMPAGMRGWATFAGRKDEYRPLLGRSWHGKDTPQSYVLWIGMNPSSASARVNDATINREITFTARQELKELHKCNIMDYRATSPKRLLEIPGACHSPNNLAIIETQALNAALVIAAWGSVHTRLSFYADDVEKLLRKWNVKVWCLGRTKTGAPRHPLYVANDTPLERYL
jgi:hypothetical protein